MGQLQGALPDFDSIYQEPSIARMRKELTDHQCEHFVAYMFERAGYLIEDVARKHGPGLDVKCYTGPATAPTPCTGVRVKHYSPDDLVTAPDVLRLRGSVAGNGGVPGYLVTTSGFVGPALVQAKDTPTCLAH
jgi:hypothetical protein